MDSFFQDYGHSAFEPEPKHYQALRRHLEWFANHYFLDQHRLLQKGLALAANAASLPVKYRPYLTLAFSAPLSWPPSISRADKRILRALLSIWRWEGPDEAYSQYDVEIPAFDSNAEFATNRALILLASWGRRVFLKRFQKDWLKCLKSRYPRAHRETLEFLASGWAEEIWRHPKAFPSPLDDVYLFTFRAFYGPTV